MNYSSDPINTLENLIYKNKTKSISIYLVLVLTVIVGLSLLPVIKLDISSQSRGIIRSKTDNVPITAIVSGRITWLALKNNAVVRKGDTLIKISSDAILIEKKTQDALWDDSQMLLEDISDLLSNKISDFKTSAAKEDFYQYQLHKNELQSKVSQTQINFNRSRNLFDKGVIASAEYEKQFYEFRFAKQALLSFMSQQKFNWENQKRELEERVKNINSTVDKIKIEENNYIVLAPISGTIESFSGLQVGSFLNASQSIAIISASDNLIVESSISPNDIGLIKKDQVVKFQMDAFNYNQWGLLEGKVIDIDKNITIQGEQAFFKVRCALNATELKLQSGYKTNVSKGMTLTSRYIITRRSLFDLLFDKVDDWLNPIQLAK